MIVDDPAGARHEAGDLIQAGVDWSGVISLGDVLKGTANVAGPIFFKSVGCAAWDLAACRVAREMIAGRQAGQQPRIDSERLSYTISDEASLLCLIHGSKMSSERIR